MTDVDRALDASRHALEKMMAAASVCESYWTVPAAPGKWSPSQIVEHVARALEESANTAAGRPSKFPTFPRLLRPVARKMFFNRVLKNQEFPRARTTKPMNPDHGPATVAAARERLEGALTEFDHACRARLAEGQPVHSTIFGSVSVLEFVQFQALHIRHHCDQLPVWPE